jgi:hypothetical protein
MDVATVVLSASGVLLTLITMVAVVVWAVAQIKETTSNLGSEIKHLAEKVSGIHLVQDDHENRIRYIEHKQ